MIIPFVKPFARHRLSAPSLADSVSGILNKYIAQRRLKHSDFVNIVIVGKPLHHVLFVAGGSKPDH